MLPEVHPTSLGQFMVNMCLQYSYTFNNSSKIFIYCLLCACHSLDAPYTTKNKGDKNPMLS